MKTKALILALTAMFALVATLSAAPAAENWDNSCASCHGSDGKAQSKQGKKLKIRDYTDAAFQSAVTDEQILAAIKDGVKEGEKERMKGFADEFSAEEIADLVKFVRDFGKK